MRILSLTMPTTPSHAFPATEFVDVEDGPGDLRAKTRLSLFNPHVRLKYLRVCVGLPYGPEMIEDTHAVERH